MISLFRGGLIGIYLVNCQSKMYFLLLFLIQSRTSPQMLLYYMTRRSTRACMMSFAIRDDNYNNHG